MTLTEFLLARIADDEAAARAASEHRTLLASHPELAPDLSSTERAGERWTCRYDTVNATREDGGRAGGIAYVGNFGMDLVAHIARHDPARVLADCEAKRRIVELADEATGLDMQVDGEFRVGGRDTSAEPYVGESILIALATPYADHEDFDEAWRP